MAISRHGLAFTATSHGTHGGAVIVYQLGPGGWEIGDEHCRRRVGTINRARRFGNGLGHRIRSVAMIKVLAPLISLDCLVRLRFIGESPTTNFAVLLAKAISWDHLVAAVLHRIIVVDGLTSLQKGDFPCAFEKKRVCS